MEAVVFIGLQGAGKTTFYRQRLAEGHVRISLDLLKTRTRELTALHDCLARKRSFVVDNTNPTILERRRYIEPAKVAGYRVIGYFFDPDVAGCLKRNAGRPGKERIPVPGIFGTKKKLQMPTHAEGFDELYRVQLAETGEFRVDPCP